MENLHIILLATELLGNHSTRLAIFVIYCQTFQGDSVSFWKTFEGNGFIYNISI